LRVGTLLTGKLNFRTTTTPRTRRNGSSCRGSPRCRGSRLRATKTAGVTTCISDRRDLPSKADNGVEKPRSWSVHTPVRRPLCPALSCHSPSPKPGRRVFRTASLCSSSSCSGMSATPSTTSTTRWLLRVSAHKPRTSSGSAQAPYLVTSRRRWQARRPDDDRATAVLSPKKLIPSLGQSGQEPTPGVPRAARELRLPQPKALVSGTLTLPSRPFRCQPCSWACAPCTR
jgi:hypothetical protein